MHLLDKQQKKVKKRFLLQISTRGSVTLFDRDSNSRSIMDHNYVNDRSGDDIEDFKRQHEYIDSTNALGNYFDTYSIGINTFSIVSSHQHNVYKIICSLSQHFKLRHFFHHRLEHQHL